MSVRNDVNNHRKPRTQKNKKKQADTLAYMAYQAYVVDFLVNRCTTQNGLILYHYMGTGKTFTAVGLIENFAMPTVLVAPKGLLPMWRTRYLQKYRAVLPKSIVCYSFEEFWEAMADAPATWRQERLLVVDEAHNLVKWLTDTLPVHERKRALHILFDFNKRILLTGTPIYWSEHDLSFLVNIARGEAMIPIDPNEFRQRYFTKKISRSFLEGWIAPLCRDATKVVGYATAGAVGSAIVRSVVEPGLVDTLATLLQKATLGVTTEWYKLVKITVKPLIEPVVHSMVRGIMSSKRLDQIALDTQSSALEHARKMRTQGLQMKRGLRYHQMNLKEREKQIPGMWKWRQANARGQLEQAKGQLALQQFMSWGLHKVAGRKDNLMLLAQMPYLVITLILMITITVVIKYFFSRDHDLELLQLDYDLLVDDMAPFVSYYSPVMNASDEETTKDSLTWTQWIMGGKPINKVIKMNSRFPRIRNEIKEVAYNGMQTSLFIRFTIGKLSFDDYALLTVLHSGTRAEGATVSFDQTSETNFHHFGRMIGNACTFQSHGPNEPQGCWEHVQYDPNECCYSLRKSHDFSSVAPKFRAFAHHVKALPNRRRVVYSNFSAASATLSAYLRKKGIAHKYLRDRQPSQNAPPMQRQRSQEKATKHQRKRRSKGSRHRDSATSHEYEDIMKWVTDNKEALLILDQSYSEGISILGVDEFHLLDPCESVAKNDQTKARVVRLDSHPPGGEVQIIEWISTLNNLSKLFASVKEWFHHRTYVWFTDMMRDHKHTITPDALVRKEVNRLAKSTLQIVRKLQSRSIERYEVEGYPRDCGAARECKIAHVGNSSSLLNDTCAVAALPRKRRSRQRSQRSRRRSKSFST